MKEFTCRDAHQFNSEDSKEEWKGRLVCPFCWPNGFLKVKDRERLSEKTPEGDAIV